MTLAEDADPSETATIIAPDPGTAWLVGALATLKARSWWVALLVLACLAVAIVYLRTADYTYTAQLRVAPAPSSARESSGLGALGSLASLTGVSIEAAPATPFRLYVEGVRARAVAVRLAADPALMHQVFAREWDARGQRWVESGGIGIGLRNTLLAVVGAPVPRWSPPDAARLQTFLAANIFVDQNAKTPLVTISMDSVDPAFAIAFLQRLHATTDSWLRERAQTRAAQNIAYLTARLPAVTAADHRQALFATLSDQEQRLMLARNPAAFAAEPFGAITTSPVPTKPRQVPILAAAVLLGLLLGVMLALLVPRRA